MKHHTDDLQLKEANLTLYAKIRKQVFEEFSDRQTTYCICGRLATGLHEMRCAKFQKKVERETIKRLQNDDAKSILLPCSSDEERTKGIL